LMPRVFSDVGDWFESEFAQFRLGAYPLRVEDFQDKDRYVLRAELPGVDPERDVRVSVDNGVLTVEASASRRPTASIAPSSGMACCAGR
jgi:HSP20 family protein